MYTSSQAIVICEPIENEAVVKLSPTASPRLSEVKNCSRPFSITIDRPKVTISVVSSPRLSAAWMSGPLQHVAEHRHRQHDDRHRPQERHVDGRDDPDADVPGDGREVAVGQVDHLHHAEQEREPAREQRVEAAGQDALDDGVDPGHYAGLPSVTPK